MSNKTDRYKNLSALGRKKNAKLELYGTFEIYAIMGSMNSNETFEPVESDYSSVHGSQQESLGASRFDIGAYYFKARNKERLEGKFTHMVFGYFDSMLDQFVLVNEIELNENMSEELFRAELMKWQTKSYNQNFFHKGLFEANLQYQDEKSSYLYPFLEEFGFTFVEYYQALSAELSKADCDWDSRIKACLNTYTKFFKDSDAALKNYFEFHNWARVHGLVTLYMTDENSCYNFNLDELPKDLEERKDEYFLRILPSERLLKILKLQKTS